MKTSQTDKIESTNASSNKKEQFWYNCASLSYGWLSEILPLNATEFLIVTCTTDGDGIYKYNTINNEWTRFCAYPKDLVSTHPEVALDKDNKLLYSLNLQHQLIKFDLNKVRPLPDGYTGSDEEMEDCDLTQPSLNIALYPNGNIIWPEILVSTEKNSKAIKYSNKDERVEISKGCLLQKLFCYGDQVHILTEIEHFIYNIKNSSFTYVQELTRMYSVSLSCYLKGSDKLLLFDTHGHFQDLVIYEYDLIENKYTKSEVVYKPIMKLTDLGIVCSRDENYVIIMGGRNMYNGVYRNLDIFVFDVKKKRFMKSKRKCPFDACVHWAGIMGSAHHDELLVFGFINELYRTSAFVNIRTLSYHVTKLICKRVCNEWIHIMAKYDGQHCKIHIDSVLDCF